MKNEQDQLEALHDIRKMMKDSSRFLSLSGLSGVFAGIYALAGAYAGNAAIAAFNAGYPRGYALSDGSYRNLVINILAICAVVLFLCIVTALYFSNNKAKKNHQKLFDHTSKKLLWHMALPLLAGGIFCIALISHGNGFVLMASPAMLLFYGLALLNSSKYTMHDIKYLGISEIILGLVASFYPGHGLFFWALGFGVLHIIYGAIMWFKYDRS